MKTKKELFFIESKRFTNTTSKESSIYSDIERIDGFVKKGMDKRFKRYKKYKVYGVILADIWKENRNKLKVYDSYINKSFFEKESLVANKKHQYNVQDFEIDGCKHGYALLSFVWEIE